MHKIIDMIETIASDAVIDEAYEWLCKKRRNRHANDDIWHLRWHWATLKPDLQRALLTGTYYFSPCRAVKVEGHSLGMWNAQDALVQKAIAIVLSDRWTKVLSPHCYHLSGRGGGKQAVRLVRDQLEQYTYVLKSDVKSYYASLSHTVLMRQVRDRLDDSLVCLLLDQFLAHLDDVGGELHLATVGIGKGSSLSPLLGALYLDALDEAFSTYAKRHDLLYCRFMDDWVLLTQKHGHLRKAVRTMNRILEDLRLTKAATKTFVGRISKGFDFLGYRFGDTPQGEIKIAKSTWQNHFDKLTQRVRHKVNEVDLLDYIKRWWSWVRLDADLWVSSMTLHRRTGIHHVLSY